eukprot:GHUV01015033.1.p1 GENE.GHUV01015033.1~~GHUV01015033.1.p1  ORF type:complete len:608 (+),score=259.19 GHUV01015033.1:140-1963(+)
MCLFCSSWERMHYGYFPDTMEAGVSAPAATAVDLSSMETGPRTHQAALSSNSDRETDKQHHASELNSKVVDYMAGLPELMSWDCMMPVNLSCTSSDAPEKPQSAMSASEDMAPVPIPEPGADTSSCTAVPGNGSSEGISESAAAAGASPAAQGPAAAYCAAGVAHPPADDSKEPGQTPQLSRANSLTVVVPEGPNSPAGPSNSSSSSYQSCAGEVTAAVAADDSSAAVVAAPVVAAAASPSAAPAAGASHSLPLSPRAAMAAAAAAATAAMQRRLMEQQKMGFKLPLPAGLPAASSLLHAVQQPQQPNATTVQPAVPAAITQPGSPATATATTAAAAASPGTKRSHSVMVGGWPVPAAASLPATVAVPAARQQQYKAKLPGVASAAAASAAAKEEVFTRTRAEALERYREKRARRSHVKKIRYILRKVNADKRPRIKGRFVSKEEMDKLGLLVPESLDKAASDGVGSSKNSLAASHMSTYIDPAAAAASGSGSGNAAVCSWEAHIQQWQQMQYADTGMPGDLLQSYGGMVDQVPASTGAAPAAGNSAAATADSLQGAAATTVSDVCAELPDLPELAAAAALPPHFGDDFLNEHDSDMSHDHHDILML